jgi:polyhydroxybutyrate depolymerase
MGFSFGSISRLTVAAMFVNIGVAACVPWRTGSSVSQSIVVNGVTRYYVVHVPRSYRAGVSTPLLILLHGHGSSTARIERSTGMSRKADKEGFIAVYPVGRGDPSTWQVFDGPTGRSDDVVFIDQLIDRLESLYDIDKKRIYVAGHSNGGTLAYRLGVELGAKIAGIGVSEALLAREFAVDAISIPVTLVAFHGRADNVVPYEGRAGGRDSRGGFLSAPASVESWARRDGCDGGPHDTVLGDVNIVKRTFSGCRSGSTVILVTINNLTHRWAGELPEDGISATDEMWAVFKAHPKQ